MSTNQCRLDLEHDADLSKICHHFSRKELQPVGCFLVIAAIAADQEVLKTTFLELANVVDDGLYVTGECQTDTVASFLH